MYNGVGLQTPRGSGGSGYTQKNLSAVNPAFKKNGNRQEFLKQLEAMRKNNLPPARKANPEIVAHQRNREILIQTMKLRQKLKQEGVVEEQIEKRVKKAEDILRQKLEKGDIQTKAKETHILTEAKEKEYMKLSKAFGLQVNHKVGSAFDFDGMKQSRLQKMQEKRIKDERFACPFEQCGKKYDLKQLLDRHLKYKHPEQYQARKQKEKEAEMERKRLKQQQREKHRKQDKERQRIYDRERDRKRDRQRKRRRSQEKQRRRKQEKSKSKSKSKSPDKEKEKEKEKERPIKREIEKDEDSDAKDRRRRQKVQERSEERQSSRDQIYKKLKKEQYSN